MNDFKDTGIQITGLVSDVGSYVSKKTGEENYSVRLFVPGMDLIRIGLRGRPDPNRFVPGKIATLKMMVNHYDGRTFFTEASK